MMRKALFLVFFTSIIAIFPMMAFAQVADQITVDVSPSNPGPNETVRLTLRSYSVDIESAEIEWSANGGHSSGGIGAKSYTVTTKAIGTTTTVVAIITPVGQAPITKSIVITPMSVDMLWQATDSAVPPFYRGKALPTTEGTVKIVAIPQIRSIGGTLLSSDAFLYDWKENYTENQSRSGYGKNAFTASMDYLNPIKHIDLDVSTRDGSTATSEALDIAPSDTKLILYAASPLYGPLFDNALRDTYTVVGGDTSIFAEPYFFSPGDPASQALRYEWKLNGSPIDTPSTPNSLFLHRDSKDTGTATLDLSITNLTKLFQEGSAHLNLSLQ